MSNLFRASQTFIANDGAALTTPGQTVASITAANLGVFGISQVQVAGAPTITTEPSLEIFSGFADGSIKKSSKITASAVKSYKGQRYQADTRDVWALGYNRKTAAGSLEVANDTAYTYGLSFKGDKNLYSERNLDIRLNFQSQASATQLKVAIQAYAVAIANPAITSQVDVILVGNGALVTGGVPDAPATSTFNGITYTIYGGTGATAYGLEFTGKDIPQFQTTQFAVQSVYFAVFADRTTGFGLTTTVSQINAMDYGTGVYNQVYNAENFDFGTEGVLNRRLWPIPNLTYRASSTLVTAATIAETVDVFATADVAEFNLTVAASLSVGQTFVIGTSNEVVRIKYFISTTRAVLEAVVVTTAAAETAAPKLGYSIINIDFQDVTSGPLGVAALANKSVRIAVPAIDTAGAYNSLSAIGTSLQTLFDAWMASTPLALPAIII